MLFKQELATLFVGFLATSLEAGVAVHPVESRVNRGERGSAAVGAKAAPQRTADTLDSLPDSFGTPHPIAVQAVSRAGKWVVACQAREDSNGDGQVQVVFGIHGSPWGDDSEMYLLLGPGPGERIDELLSRSASDRWIAFRQNGLRWLLDTENGGRTRIEAPHLHDIDEVGRLLVAEPSERSETLKVAVPSSKDEQTIDYGEGVLWKAAFILGTSLLEIDVVSDENADGQIELPFTTTSRSNNPCRGSGSYSSFSKAPDGFERRMFDLDRNHLLPFEHVAAHDGAVLGREPDGSLVWVDMEDPVLAAPSSCGERVLAVWGETRAVLTVCAEANDQAALRLFDADGSLDVGTASSKMHGNAPFAPIASFGGRATNFFLPEGPDFFIDLVGRRRYERDATIIASEGRRVLELTDARALQVFDASTGRTTLVSDGPHKFRFSYKSGNWVLFDERPARILVVDMLGERSLGYLADAPYFVDRSGRVLMASEPSLNSFTAGGMVSEIGPLRWFSPTP